jgi:hypothetical protein
MAWELLAIWAIVAVTIIWFNRDERRLATEKLYARARHFATAPAYQHQARSPATLPVLLRDEDLDKRAELQRRFREAMLRR